MDVAKVGFMDQEQGSDLMIYSNFDNVALM